MVCSLISKSPDFIFIGIDYGGILNEWAPIICYFIIKYLTSPLEDSAEYILPRYGLLAM